MVTGRRSELRWRALLVALALVGAAPRPARAHPLHTTLTEVSSGPTPGTVRLMIRVFADDFGRASRVANGGRSDPALYLRRAVGVFDGTRALPLRSCGVRQSGGMLWLCLEADAPSSLSTLRLRNAILCELFDDQVNVVRSLLGSSPRSVLFTRGDGAKPMT